jgi:uracil-DNA glycosylase family 4
VTTGPLGQRAVFGAGPSPCDYMIVGDAPAWQELRDGKALAGLPGRVFWTYALRCMGMTRSDFYVTNLVKHCLGIGDEKQDPTEAEIRWWAGELESELRAVQPKYILTLGPFSTRWFLGDDVDMSWAHGLQHRMGGEDWAFMGGLGDPPVVIPISSPGAGLYESRQLTLTYSDLEAAGEIVHGRGQELVEDRFPAPEYKLGEVPAGAWPECGLDTEGWVDDPWSLQWSVREGHAAMLLNSDRAGLDAFRDWLVKHKPRVLLHYAIHDLQVLRAMGIDLTALGIPWIDTLQLAANIQYIPRGLKPLARRLCGMKMRDYEDVVEPHYEAEMQRRLSLEPDVEPDVRTVAKHTGKALKKPISTWRSTRGKELFKARGLENQKTRRERLAKLLGMETRLHPKYVPEADFRAYACRDPDATLRIYPKLGQLAKEYGVLQVAALDQAVLPLIDEMQQNGMIFDRERVVKVDAHFAEHEAEHLEIVRILADKPDLNVKSQKQLNPVLFGPAPGWNLPPQGRVGVNGLFSTDDDTLAILADRHPGLEEIRSTREFSKLRDSYSTKLLKMIPEDTRFWTYHPEFSTTKVVSGRLAEWILTFPAQTKEGQMVRDCAVAPPGYVMWSTDLSQIEYRITADESRDPILCDIFLSGVDMHTTTASKMFGVAYDKVDKKTQRTPCKTLNYLILYGGNEYTLFQRMRAAGVTGFDVDACKEMIDAWFRVYNGVQAYAHKTVDEVRATGRVRDRWGRIRPLPAIYLEGEKQLDRLRLEAERQALNFKMQGGATGYLERVEILLYRKGFPQLRARGIDVRPVLQYHDELVGICPEGTEDEVKKVVLGAMTAFSKEFVVPIEAEWTTGPTWGSLKD